MDKFDYKRDERALYFPGKRDFELAEIPPQWYLAAHGHGDPNTSPDYQAAVETLYSASYFLKFATRTETGRDYAVWPLEGLWWSDIPSQFASLPKSEWNWTMLIRQPDWLTPAQVSDGLAAAAASKGNPAIEALEHVQLDEGLCVQIMHVGSYDDEAPTLRRLHEQYLPEHHLVERGKHHEIYLGDPRRTAPEKLRTVLRQPVSRLPGV